MVKKPNHVCKVCGESYYFCPNCSGSTATEKYRKMFCSRNCRDVFQTCVAYNMNHITKDEAKSTLSQLDLSKRAQFSDQLKADIDEIMKVEIPQLDNIPVVELDRDFVETLSTTPEVEKKKAKYKNKKSKQEEIYGSGVVTFGALIPGDPLIIDEESEPKWTSSPE